MPEAAHAGRLFDHIHLRTLDLEASKRFYVAAAGAALGVPLSAEGDGWFSIDELFVSDDTSPAGRVHFAFQAPEREAVERFHEAVLPAGGRDNGGPGEREYHPGYYAAYAIDPDGNNVEAVYHGPVRKSAPSVVFTWDE